MDNYFIIKVKIMEQSRNASQQPAFLLVFGFIVLPQKYEVERDVVVTLVGVLSMVSVIFNAILIIVIIKDPLKQLRNITATLLAFNSTANVFIGLVMVMDSVFFWSDRNVFPEIVVYLNSCAISLYFIGNVLHTLNIYGSVVVPVRYAYLALKVRKILVQFMASIFIINTSVILIPLYTLPKKNVPAYIEGVLTFICAQLALLTIIFIYLYAKIFQTLYTRKRTLSLSFHIERSSRQGMRITKKTYEVAKTLFIHVLFFVAVTVPETIIVMMLLHCTSCADSSELRLAALFSIPCVITTFVFHPILWLSRLSTYKQAMKQILGICRTSNSISSTADKPQTGTVRAVTSA